MLTLIDLEIEHLKEQIAVNQIRENNYYQLIKWQRDEFIKQKESIYKEYKKASKKMSKRYMKLVNSGQDQIQSIKYFMNGVQNQ